MGGLYAGLMPAAETCLRPLNGAEAGVEEEWRIVYE